MAMLMKPVIDPETEFFTEMMKLSYGEDVEKKLRALSSHVPWAKGWPENKKAFWNAEAFMWSRKITKEKRALIAEELAFLKGRNLDLGCGAYSYLPSTGFDLSEKMLQFNEQCYEKVIGDVEKSLPFADGSFDSVTAIFLLNYVVDYQQLLTELYRVLKNEGYAVVVLSLKKINDWQRQKEVHSFSSDMLAEQMVLAGFQVHAQKKEDLLFVKGLKAI